MATKEKTISGSTLNEQQIAWIYQECLERYGEDTQLLVLAEECNELARAIVRYMQFRTSENYENNLTHIREEMADVLNLIDQFRTIPSWGPMIFIIKLTKLARLYNRLKESTKK